MFCSLLSTYKEKHDLKNMNEANKEEKPNIPDEVVMTRIYEIRGQKVMLDFDLVELYDVRTKVLKQSVRRNIKRFPEDFKCELTKEEFQYLRSQIVTLKQEEPDICPWLLLNMEY